MKQLEREHITNYRWWRPNGEDIRPEHVGALDEAAMARVAPAGGEIVSPVIDIPPGRFAYALHPDGNSIALFESHR